MSYVGASGGVALPGFTMPSLDSAAQGAAQAMPGMMQQQQPQPQAMGLSVQQQQQMGVQSFAVPQPQLPQQYMQQFPAHSLQQAPSMVTPMPFPMTAPEMQPPETSIPP